MALTTYDALCTAVADWLERTDLGARAADFVALAEARMNRQLRLAAMEGEATLVAAAGVRRLPLPGQCCEALGLWREEGAERIAMRYRTPLMAPRGAEPGVPRFWTLEGGEVALDRPCAAEQVFILRQVERLGLSPAAPTNAVLAEHPDLYLFGALAEAAPYLRDGEMAAMFLGRFEMALAEAKVADGRRYAMARLTTDLPTREAFAC